MATLLFFDLKPDSTKRTEKVEVREDGHLFIAGTDGDGSSYIQEWDIRNVLADRHYLDFSDDATFDGEPILEAERTLGEIYRVVMNVYYDESGTVPDIDTESLIETFPAYPLWLSMDAQAQLSSPTDTKSVSLTYAHKQQEAVDAIENIWRPQKRAWMRDALEYSDVNPDLMKYLGIFLNRAEQCIQSLFQDEDVDPLVVAEVAKVAAQGASDVDTIEEFSEWLHWYITSPYADLLDAAETPARIWVTVDGSTVTQIEATQTLTQGYNTPRQENYNSITHNWVVENQPGVVDIDDESPAAGDTMTASLTDYDGVKDGTPSWQWQQESSTPDTYEDISGATSDAYTVPAGTTSGTKYKATVIYEDSYGPNQSAASKAIEVE